MSEQDPELEAFSKFIVALEPWLGEVVLVGEWVHRLYRLDYRRASIAAGSASRVDQMARFTHGPQMRFVIAPKECGRPLWPRPLMFLRNIWAVAFW